MTLSHALRTDVRKQLDEDEDIDDKLVNTANAEDAASGSTNNAVSNAAINVKSKNVDNNVVDNDNDNDDDNDNDKDNAALKFDVKKINTKVTASEKRELFARVMSQQHSKLNSGFLKGAWDMLKPAFTKAFQKKVTATELCYLLVCWLLLFYLFLGHKSDTSRAVACEQT